MNKPCEEAKIDYEDALVVEWHCKCYGTIRSQKELPENHMVLTEALYAYVDHGKIRMIKVVRAHWKISLKAAKAICDEWVVDPMADAVKIVCSLYSERLDSAFTKARERDATIELLNDRIIKQKDEIERLRSKEEI